jgi:dihydrofolate reductase
MKLCIIAAKGKNNVIGNKGTLPWHLPADLAHFKEVTSGYPVLMGRKTFESIGRALPDRMNIVITSGNKSNIPLGVYISPSLADALSLTRGTDTRYVFVIGGERLYREAMLSADVLYITEVEAEFQGDTVFPGIDSKKWKEVTRERHEKDENNPYDYSFVTYERRMPKRIGLAS